MELSEKFSYNLENLIKAVSTFKISMEKDYSELDATGVDLIIRASTEYFYCLKPHC